MWYYPGEGNLFRCPIKGVDFQLEFLSSSQVGISTSLVTAQIDICDDSVLCNQLLPPTSLTKPLIPAGLFSSKIPLV